MIATALVAIRPAGAQTWTEIFPAGGPTGAILGRQPAHIGYDSANNRLIVYFAGNPAAGSPGPEVWVLTNANGLGGAPVWIQLLPSGLPPSSNGQGAVVYEPASNRLIAYGGCFAFCSPALSEVTVLTNANGLGGTPSWLSVTVTNPQSRVGESTAYSPANNTLISFGGNFAFFGTDQNDTRLLSNANGLVSPSSWNPLSISSNLPPIRTDHRAAYDQANNHMIIFGGWNLISVCCPTSKATYNDTWVLSNANGLGGAPTWTQILPSGTLPDGRVFHSAVWDSLNNKLFVYGGLRWNQATQDETILGDLWELSYANGLGGSPVWTQIYGAGTPPGPNYAHSAVFDSAHQRMIVFGGGNPTSGFHKRVWIFEAVLNVSIDIKPGSFPNSINLGSNGTMPVAILSSATFDARTVDSTTVTVASAPAKLKGQGTPMTSIEDVNGDGRPDLIVHVSTGALQLTEADTEAVLEGRAYSGTAIRGVDSIRVVP